MSTIEATKDLKDLLISLNERKDLTILDYQVNEPLSKNDIDINKGVLPESLLDFYSVMNGCEFKAFFTEDSHLEIGIKIPSLDKVGTFVSDTIDYNFSSEISFLPVEFIDPTATTSFTIRKGDKNINQAKLVSCWAGQEYESIRTYSNLGEFIEKAIQFNLSIFWFSSQFKSQSQSVRRRISQPDVRSSIFFVGARVQFKRFGPKGSIIRLVTLTESVKNSNIWALVDFDGMENPLWAPAYALDKRGKQLEPHDKILIKSDDFLLYLKSCNAEETAMLLKDITFYHIEPKSTISLNDLTILESSYHIYAIFRNMNFDDFIEWSYSIISQWAVLSKSGFYEKHDFKEKKGKFKIRKRSYGFAYFALAYNLIGGIAILLKEKKHQNPEYKLTNNIQEKFDLISGDIKSISLGIDEYELNYNKQNYCHLLKILNYLTTINGSLKQNKSPIFRGYKINKKLSLKGLDNNFNSLISI
ncbi:hypothetical protein [Flavivirga algicola]|uniref:Uncharacterized protein n=1 Tax=Flavivirga algicola TaxID=2729136 RepID=A0ABX1S106_9FLAO|nr:hypothetical protein [Flavivirga algicola]NMH88563.1 hypothetical protein [Flavivirga algicola]